MRTAILTLLLGVALFVPAAAGKDDRLATIHLPEGFVIEAFADVPNARQMAWGEKRTLFVGTRREGRVFAVTDEDGDGRGERVREVASGLRMPSGVAFRDGALYVAAVSTILRFDGIESRLDHPPAPAVVTDRLDATVPTGSAFSSPRVDACNYEVWKQYRHESKRLLDPVSGGWPQREVGKKSPVRLSLRWRAIARGGDCAGLVAGCLNIGSSPNRACASSQVGPRGGIWRESHWNS